MTNEDIEQALAAAASRAQMTACEQYEARRKAMESMGHTQSEMLWNAVKNELHQEAIDADNPCPCGMIPTPLISGSGND